MAVDCSELSIVLYNLAKLHAAEPGVDTIDAALKKIQDNGFEVSRDQLVNAVVEASTARARDLTQAQKQIATIRREARTDKQLHKAIADLEQHLKEGTLPAPVTRQPNTSAAIQELQARKAAVREALKQSPQAVKQRLEKQIKNMLERIERNEFATAIDETSLPISGEIAQLTFERDRLRKTINKKIRDAAPRTVFQGAVEGSQLYKGLTASFDFPPIFRQGRLALGRPRAVAEAFAKGVKAMASERSQYDTMKEIESRPNYPLYQKFGVRLRDMDDRNNQDEHFMSRILEKVPGYKASGRGYTVFLNKLRADLFDTWANAWTANGIPNEQEGQRIAYITNVFTGEGSMGSLERVSPLLNATFFSPRNLVSRLQVAWTVPEIIAGEIADLTGLSKLGTVTIPRTNIKMNLDNIAGGKQIRRATAAELARVTAGSMVMYALADAIWGDDENFEIVTDPQHSMAGAMKFGNTYLDPLGGMRPLLVLVSRLGTMERTTSRGESVDLRGPDKPYAGDSPMSLVGKYFRGKLAPAPGALYDWMEGTDFKGEPVSFVATAGNLTVPMSVQDMLGAYKEHGLVGGSALSGLVMTGMGAAQYEPRSKAKKKSYRNIWSQ